MAANSNLVVMEEGTAKDTVFRRHLTNQQVTAIRLETELGDQIRRQYPQLVDGYRAGLTASNLVERYALESRFGVKSKTAIAAVRHAIRGYHGDFHDSYIGLVPTHSERATLALAHNRQTGIEATQKRKGIHALSNKQKADAGRKGGLIGGPLSYLLHIGCHALPPEVVREHCRLIAPLGGRKGGRASVLAKGLVPYLSATAARCSEMEFASELATNPLYLGPVRANFNKIASKVNDVFNTSQPPYTRITFKIALQRYRRQRKSRGRDATNPEMSFAEMLTLEPAYQIAPRMKAEQIACKVNNEYHHGRSVRNAISVRAAIRRFRQAGTD